MDANKVGSKSGSTTTGGRNVTSRFALRNADVIAVTARRLADQSPIKSSTDQSKIALESTNQNVQFENLGKKTRRRMENPQIFAFSFIQTEKLRSICYFFRAPNKNIQDKKLLRSVIKLCEFLCFNSDLS